MNDHKLASPLAEALALKGYTELTLVQKAVLDGPEGQDLLVSAQTGSGKTVAFGIALGTDLLDGKDTLPFASSPLALIIAPTRELALQVRQELEWLYAPAKAQIASCVGGMDYRNEKRSLERGAHIVVGTPGRLRDHLERRSLDLSMCRVAVLDEADEMLDLGFSEDLEFILSTAPKERRTLLFSATISKDIEKLARNFQKDALRISTKSNTKQHADIEYRAFCVAPRDKEHAIFNILRFYEARTAIVFVKTRANVNHLFARMSNRGFQVVTLSGELSQSERLHALQALRSGRAKVCIATDVAARGIDLPGLDLVVHADLPSNHEILLHRSGRTGRAGNKGVAAVVVAQSEQRKANRLFNEAKVAAEWCSPPNADDVQQRDDERLLNAPIFAEDIGTEAQMVQDLLDKHGGQAIAAAFVREWRKERGAPEVLSNVAVPSMKNEPAQRREDFGPAKWFVLSIGHEDRAEARWLLPKICDAGGITKKNIGAIRVKSNITYVQISEDVASRFATVGELEAGLTIKPSEHGPEDDAPGKRTSGKGKRSSQNFDAKPAYAKKSASPKSAAPKKAYSRKSEGAKTSFEGAHSYKDKPYKDKARSKDSAPYSGKKKEPYIKDTESYRLDSPKDQRSERTSKAEGTRGEAKRTSSRPGSKPKSPGKYSEGKKEQSGKARPGAPKYARPKKSNAADTSKRFSPPKKSSKAKP